MPALVCDLSGAEATAATVDALARLALSLKRRGSRLLLRHASPDLVELIELMGLAEVLRVEPGR
jgi:anti-anti-sigma regulatory factor